MMEQLQAHYYLQKGLEAGKMQLVPSILVYMQDHQT